MRDSEHYRVRPGRRLRLSEYASDDDGGLDRPAAAAMHEALRARLIELEELLAADGRYGLLVVLQGMDTSGKDSTIRSVFSGMSPANVHGAGFKAPTSEELAHDFLWRIHPHTPRRGQLAIFNRSHYEDVLIVRVRQLVSPERVEARYDHINAFERLLHDEGTKVVKFFLHISRDYQKERLERRLRNPQKHWKFNPNDLVERQRWDDYQEAYELALTRCSTEAAPWYVIPAERRWFRDVLVTRILVETLEALPLRYPPPDFDPAKIRVE
jgi:PPK2 family polyphosphate:nucleotide phosphotransferase